MTRGVRPHLVWGSLGAVAVPALWYAWSLPGMAVMFGAIAMAFVLWRRMGPRGSWVALIALGLGMSGVLGWQAATGSRCPEGGAKVFLDEDKPPVGCAEIRASAATMSAFFALVALIGIGAPLYARGMEDGSDLDDPTPAG